MQIFNPGSRGAYNRRMMDSEDEMLLAAVDRLDAAAASVRRADIASEEVAALLRLITDVQRRIMVLVGEKPKRRAAVRFMVVKPVH